MKRRRDFLSLRTNQLQKNNRAAASAISLITSTIARLKMINETRDLEIQAIEQYMTELAEVREQIVTEKEHDQIVITNFSALISN